MVEISNEKMSWYKKLNIETSTGQNLQIDYISKTLSLEPWEFLENSDLSSYSGEKSIFTPCNCINSNNHCSNSFYCSCARNLEEMTGIGRFLSVLSAKKVFLNLKADEDYKIIECSDACNCDKSLCKMTLFNFKNTLDTSSFYLYENKEKCWELRNKIKIRKGEFLFEISGVLKRDQPEKTFKKLTDVHYLEVEKSNLSKFIIEGDDWNTLGVRIFSYIDEKWMCRLGLFAIKKIEIGKCIIMKPWSV